MTFESNVAAIEALLAAIRDRDEAAFGAAYADDAVVRQSGVPESLGGVLRGRNDIVENFRRQDPAAVDVRFMFGDATHVCVVGKLSGIVTGTEKLKGNKSALCDLRVHCLQAARQTHRAAARVCQLVGPLRPSRPRRHRQLAVLTRDFADRTRAESNG